MANALAPLLIWSAAFLSVVRTTSEGIWPQNWPAEFEAFRTQSRTAQPMTGGLMEDWHQISFNNREEFDRLWPAIVKLLDRGSEISVRPTGYRREYFGQKEWDYSFPVVRIFVAPDQPYGYMPGIDANGKKVSSDLHELWYRVKRREPLSDEEKKQWDAATVQDPILPDHDAMKENNGRWVKSGPPWPDDIRNENGELPEMAHWEDIDGVVRWLAGPWPRNREVGIRCRVDIELVEDGEIIDLEQIAIPDYLKVVDYRANPAQPVVRP